MNTEYAIGVFSNENNKEITFYNNPVYLGGNSYYKENEKLWITKHKSLIDLEGVYIFRNERLIFFGGWNGLRKRSAKLKLARLKIDFENYNDIFFVMSDDFFPPKDWDSILIEQFKNHDGALLVNDGYSNQNNILSIPIMTWSCLKRLDTIVYHPVYNHMFSDNELFDILKEKNLIKKTDANIIFEHRHWITKKRIKDDNDDKLASQDIFEADRELYLKRKSLRLSEKLKVDLKKQYLLSVLICTIPSRKNALNCGKTTI
jgi:hypothetical protein